MVQRKFQVYYDFDSHGYGIGKGIHVDFYSPVGVPYFRVDGGAWQPMPIGSYGRYEGFLLYSTIGVKTIEYKDDNGTVLLCKLNILPVSSCTLQRYGVKHFFDPQKVGMYFLGGGELSNTSKISIEKLPVCASLDGFITSKCGTTNDVNSTSSFPTPFLSSEIPSGRYSLSYKFKDGSCLTEIATDILNKDILAPLTATFIKTDVTSNGGSDGTIQVIPEGGSGNYSFSWADDIGEITAIRNGLPLGEYVCTVSDDITLEYVELTIYIEEPSPGIDVPAFFQVPSMQSVHFVIDQTVNNCNTFQTLDNKLFCDQVHPFYRGQHYQQKFNQCDSFSVQLRSSYPNISARLVSVPSGVVVDNYTANLTLEALNIPKEYPVRLQENGGNTTRVYFTGLSAFPLVINVGDSFELFNSTNGIDGTYSISSLQVDDITSQQYFVINVNYSSVNPSENAESRFLANALPFNIYEFPVDFSAMLPGTYQIEIDVTNDSLSDTLSAISEPINIQTDHKNCLFIEWSNIDNAYDIDYSNNIVHRMRIEGVMFKRIPASEKVGIRTTAGNYNLLSAKPKRALRADFFDLPPYLIEKMSIMFDSDIKRFNGMDITSEEGLEEPAYRVRYGLTNATAIVEFPNWFGSYNTDDLGGIQLPSNAFIIANEGLVKR